MRTKLLIAVFCLSLSFGCAPDSSNNDGFQDVAIIKSNSERENVFKSLQGKLAGTMEDPGALVLFLDGQPLTEDHLSTLEETILDLKSLVLYRPDDFESHFLLGQVYQALGRNSDSVESLKTCLASLPTPKTSKASIIEAESRSTLAVIYLHQRKLSLAEDELRQAIIVNPINLNYVYNLATVLLESGQTEAAKATLQDLLDKSPNHEGAIKALRLIEQAEEDLASEEDAA